MTRVDVERESEPVSENLAALGAAVVQDGCAVGFAQDLDADRLALVAETGTAPGEEYTLLLVVDHLAAPRSPVGPGGGQERVDHARGG